MPKEPSMMNSPSPSVMCAGAGMTEIGGFSWAATKRLEKPKNDAANKMHFENFVEKNICKNYLSRMHELAGYSRRELSVTAGDRLQIRPDRLRPARRVTSRAPGEDGVRVASTDAFVRISGVSIGSGSP